MANQAHFLFPLALWEGKTCILDVLLLRIVSVFLKFVKAQGDWNEIFILVSYFQLLADI